MGRTSQGHKEEVGGVMFTVEIRVNDEKIISIVGVNRGAVRSSNPESCLYTYAYLKRDDKGTYRGSVRHIRSEGMDKLIMLILKDVEKKRKKLTQKD